MQVEGFSGCPSAAELGSAWGFDLDGVKSDPDESGGRDWELQSADAWMFRSMSTVEMSLQDLMVPGVDFSSMMVDGLSKRQGASCGKRKSVIYRQLIELLTKTTDGDAADGEDNGDDVTRASLNVRDFGDTNDRVDEGGNDMNGINFGDRIDRVDGGGIGLNGSDFSNMNDRVNGGGDGMNDQDFEQHWSVQQQGPFTTLLMWPTHQDPKETSNMLDGSLKGQTTQIWDFHSGKSITHEEADPFEIGIFGKDCGFTIKSYSELMRESSLTNSKMSNQARWSVLQSYNLLKWHEHAHREAVKALETGASLSIVIRRIEEALSSDE